jgi:hypothetical protein
METEMKTLHRCRIAIVTGLISSMILPFPMWNGRAQTTPFVDARLDAGEYQCVVGVRKSLGQRATGSQESGSLQDRLNRSNFGSRGDSMEPLQVVMLIGGVAIVAVLIAAVVSDSDDDDDDDQVARPTSRYVASTPSITTPAGSISTGSGTESTNQTSESSRTVTTVSPDGNTTTTVTTTNRSSSSSSSGSSSSSR